MTSAIGWDFKELSVSTHVGVSSVFLAWMETQLPLAPWAEDDQDYEVHRCFAALTSKWKWVHQLGHLRRSSARLLFELSLLLWRLKEVLWRGTSPVLDGQDYLYSKYPADHSDVVGLMDFVMWGLKFIPAPLMVLVTLQWQKTLILQFHVYLSLSFCLTMFTWLIFTLDQNGMAWYMQGNSTTGQSLGSSWNPRTG